MIVFCFLNIWLMFCGVIWIFVSRLFCIGMIVMIGLFGVIIVLEVWIVRFWMILFWGVCILIWVRLFCVVIVCFLYLVIWFCILCRLEVDWFLMLLLICNCWSLVLVILFFVLVMEEIRLLSLFFRWVDWFCRLWRWVIERSCCLMSCLIFEVFFLMSVVFLCLFLICVFKFLICWFNWVMCFFSWFLWWFWESWCVLKRWFFLLISFVMLGLVLVRVIRFFGKVSVCCLFFFVSSWMVWVCSFFKCFLMIFRLVWVCVLFNLISNWLVFMVLLLVIRSFVMVLFFRCWMGFG